MKKTNQTSTKACSICTCSRKKKLLVGTVLVAAIAWGVWSFTGTNETLLPTLKPNTIVAQIGGEKVRLSDLQKVKESIPQLKDIPMEVVYNQLVEAYVNNKIILDNAKKEGLQKDERVRAALKNAEEQILFQAYLNKKAEEKMSPEKLQDAYKQYLTSFVPQDEIHARHILVNSQKQAKDIIVQLLAGADFATLANEHSIDKDENSANGGDLGYFTKNMMIPEFADAAFSIPVGQISTRPVKTPFGWHVIKVEDKRKSPAPTYEQVEDDLKAAYGKTLMSEVIKEERDKVTVEIFDVFATQPEVTATEPVPQIAAPVVEETGTVAEPVADEAPALVAEETPAVPEEPAK